jgi:hypothetical protein
VLVGICVGGGSPEDDGVTVGVGVGVNDAIGVTVDLAVFVGV